MKFNYIFLLTILLATYTLGCTGGGGGANIKDVAKIVPESYGLTYVNVEKVRGDEDLKILLGDVRQDFESDFRNLCSFDEVSWIARTMSISVIGGNIDMNNFRENLKKQGYEKSSYSDVEFWSSRYGFKAVAIVGDKIISGSESDVRKTINVMKDEEKSMYEGDAKEVIDRLPDGIAQVVSFRMGMNSMIPWGISIFKETSDTLKVAGFMMFSDDREAEKSKTSVRQLLETNRDAFDIEVRRDGKFIVFNEKFRVEDYKSIGKELIPGFEAVFAIAGLIAGIYLFRRIRGGKK